MEPQKAFRPSLTADAYRSFEERHRKGGTTHYRRPDIEARIAAERARVEAQQKRGTP